MLNGKIPPPLAVPTGQTDEEEIDRLTQTTNQLIQHFEEVHTTILPLARKQLFRGLIKGAEAFDLFGRDARSR